MFLFFIFGKDVKYKIDLFRPHFRIGIMDHPADVHVEMRTK